LKLLIEALILTTKPSLMLLIALFLLEIERFGGSDTLGKIRAVNPVDCSRLIYFLPILETSEGYHNLSGSFEVCTCECRVLL
jgi:hypothetical protein